MWLHARVARHRACGRVVVRHRHACVRAGRAAPTPPGGATTPPAKRSPVPQRAFATPEDAGRALIEALDSDNNRAIYAVLGRGSGAADLRSAIRCRTKGMRTAIVAAYRIRVKLRDGRRRARRRCCWATNDYPFPYPLVKVTAGLAIRREERRRGDRQPPHRQQRARRDQRLPRLCRCPARVRAARSRQQRPARVRAEAEQHAGHTRRPLLGDEGR